MDNKELNVNEIVKIEQMPIIFSQLEIVGKQIDEELAKVKDLEATEENKQEVKKIRTGINNTLKAFEDKRKEIKNKILEDYNVFNDKYESEVKTKLQNASEKLKVKIDEIEKEQLKAKEIELGNFMEEHIKANHLENILGNIAQFVQLANLKVNLSTSLKSLKEDAKSFIEKVANEVKLIELEEQYNDEILLEYQNNGLDYTRAKLDVITKHKQLEELAKQREQVQEIVKQEEIVEKIVEEITMPKEIVTTNLSDSQETFIVQFTVKGTKSQIIKLKEFLKEEGISYE